jgi:Flp pilus assembly protein TadG
MKLFRSHHTHEEGQSIILVALAILGLVAFLGLAVDGGNIYLQRRNVQNAADGAAIAGAVALALNTDGSLTEEQLCAKVREYSSTRNLSDEGLLEVYYTPRLSRVTCQPVPAWPPVGTEGASNTASGVSVRVGRQFSSYVSQIVGQPRFTVRADAAAQFGAPASMLGVQPIAVYEEWLESHVPQGSRNDPNLTFSLWTDDKGTPGATDLSGADRGWLNLDCNYPDKCNSSENDVKDWMLNGNDMPIRNDYELQSSPGVRAASLHQPYVYEGKILLLPIYEYKRTYTNKSVCDPTSSDYLPGPGPLPESCRNNPEIEAYRPDADAEIFAYTSDNSLSGNSYYKISSFAAFKVTGFTDSGGNKSIDGHFIDYIADGEIDPGRTSQYGVIIIKLTQ